jgi:tRNA pseudouridine38-40 synthase
MIISYDGSKFYGFQRLNDLTSVQKTLEEALCKICKTDVVVKGAGRTDRGVHAYGQCVSFKVNIDITLEGLKDALNSMIKPYIYVKDIIEVDEGFHARFSVVDKEYIYKINIGEYNPLLSDYVYQCEYQLNVEKMKEVSKLYLGGHNFHNFVSGERDNYDAIINSIVFKMEDNILNIIFNGKSFYRYMVRNLVGMMIEVGRGKEDIKKVEEMLNTKKEMFGFTAPSCGLYLNKINY